MDSESRFIIRKMCMDLFILLCVASPLLALSLWAEPHARGYFSDDRSLMLPYRTSSVPAWLLSLIGFALNIIAIVCVEVARSRRGGGAGGIVAQHRLAGCGVPAWATEVYQVLGVFAFGAACQQLTTTLAKYVVGRLRPHFFSVCQPLPDTSLVSSDAYIQQYTCQGTDAALLKDMRLSFPSAHAAFGAYTTVFFAMYLHCRFKWGSKLLRHGLQFVAILFAWYTGLSRVIDHMHHASDVAVGFVIGTLYAVLVFLYVSHVGRRSRRATWPASSETPYQGSIRP